MNTQKNMKYMGAFFYALKYVCPMEYPLDRDHCIRFELHNREPFFYLYWYGTGEKQSIEIAELNAILKIKRGYRYSDGWKIATSFAKPLKTK